MGALSNYAELELLDHVLKVGSYSRPANLYLALCTAAPDDTKTGATITEVSGGSYARQACDSWDAAASRATANSGAITFPEATASWGTVTHFAICDALTNGNMIAYGALSASKAVEDDDTFTVAIGDLDVSFNANGMSTYLANELLDHVFAGAAFTVPTNIYAALCTAAPTDASTGSTITEPADNYARKICNGWDAAAAGLSDNTAAITFVAATTGWGTVTHFAVLDALSAGNVLFHAALTASKGIGQGDVAQFAAGTLDITLD